MENEKAVETKTTLKERQLQRGVEELSSIMHRLLFVVQGFANDEEKKVLRTLSEDAENVVKRVRGEKVVRSYKKKNSPQNPWFKETVD